MSNHLRRAKTRIKTLALPYYYRYYQQLNKKSYPDFILFGAMKSGTTSLFQYLSGHPDLLYSSIKEPSYFSYNYNRGIKYYLSHFPKRKEVNSDQLIFEGSVTYLHHPLAAKRIKQIIPNIRLIAILRDPIERAISHFNYYSSPSYFTKKNPQSIEKRDINQAFLSDIEGLEKVWNKQYCQFGLYGKQLKDYFNSFDSENILILDFDEFKKNSKLSLNIISEFLGIDSTYFESYKETKKKIKLPKTESFNSDYYKELNLFLSHEYSIELLPKFENKLKEFFKEDVKMLHDLTGKTFAWSTKYL